MPAASPRIRNWGIVKTPTVLMLCDSVASQPFIDCVIPIGDVTIDQREQAGSQVDLRQSLLQVPEVVRGNRSVMDGGPTSMPVAFGVGRDNPAGFALFLPLPVITSAIPCRRDARGSRQHPTMHGTALPRRDRRP